jgi:hypothetical protein
MITQRRSYGGVPEPKHWQKLQGTVGEGLVAGFVAFSLAIINASLRVSPDKRGDLNGSLQHYL